MIISSSGTALARDPPQLRRARQRLSIELAARKSRCDGTTPTCSRHRGWPKRSPRTCRVSSPAHGKRDCWNKTPRKVPKKVDGGNDEALEDHDRDSRALALRVATATVTATLHDSPLSPSTALPNSSRAVCSLRSNENSAERWHCAVRRGGARPQTARPTTLHAAKTAKSDWHSHSGTHSAPPRPFTLKRFQMDAKALHKGQESWVHGKHRTTGTRTTTTHLEASSSPSSSPSPPRMPSPTVRLGPSTARPGTAKLRRHQSEDLPSRTLQHVATTWMEQPNTTGTTAATQPRPPAATIESDNHQTTSKQQHKQRQEEAQASLRARMVVKLRSHRSQDLHVTIHPLHNLDGGIDTNSFTTSIASAASVKRDAREYSRSRVLEERLLTCCRRAALR